LSEKILNSTSAQLGHTMPFTLVHAGKYNTEDKLEKIHKIQILKTTQKKQTMQNTKEQICFIFLNIISGLETDWN